MHNNIWTPLLHYERVLDYLLGYQNKYDFNKLSGKINSVTLAMKIQSVKQHKFSIDFWHELKH